MSAAITTIGTTTATAIFPFSDIPPELVDPCASSVAIGEADEVLLRLDVATRLELCCEFCAVDVTITIDGGCGVAPGAVGL